MGRCAVILVHGTWAPETAWVQTDSPLRRSLAAALPDAAIHAFDWSGANDHQARIDAGAELAYEIKRIHRDSGETEFFLIGHSHGGNVILYALQDPDAAALVRRIAFLGTPFLEIVKIDIGEWTGRTQIATQIAGRLGLMAMLPLLLAMSGFQAVIAYVALIVLYFGVEQKLVAGVGDFLGDRQSDFLAQTRIRAPAVPAFVATVSEDEALDYLTLVDFFSSGLWRAAGLAAAAVVAAGAAIWLLSPTPPAALERTLWIALPIVLLVPVLGALISRALRGSPIGFGGESLPVAATVRVAPLAMPPWPLPPESRVHACKPQTAVSGLRHCALPDDAGVIAALSDWLSSPARADAEAAPEAAAPPHGPGARRKRSSPGARWAPALAVALIAMVIVQLAWEDPGPANEVVETLPPEERQLTLTEIEFALLDHFAAGLAATPPPPGTAPGDRSVAPILAEAVATTARARGWDLDFNEATGRLEVRSPPLAGDRVIHLYRRPLVRAVLKCRRPPSAMTSGEGEACVAGTAPPGLPKRGRMGGARYQDDF